MLRTVLSAALIFFYFNVSAQDTASTFWQVVSTTTVPATPVNTGNVSGADEILSNVVINGNAAATTYQRVTVPDGAWVAETVQNDSRYVQFSLSPAAGNNFTVSNISLSIGGAGGTNMKANVAYSKDSTFSSSTVIYTTGTGTLPSGSFIDVANAPGLLLLDGEKLYLRIYPYYRVASTGKYLTIKDVLISGYTASFFTAPSVTTTAVSGTGSTSSQSGGTITLEGGSAVTQRGVVWGASANPTLESNIGFTNDGVGTGSYTSTLTSLTPNTVYHVRAYATNSFGTGYGDDIQFATTLAPTNYYNKAGTDVTNPLNWGKNSDGTGASPSDFLTDAQQFNIVNPNASMSSGWIVSGTDSKVIVGNGTTPFAFTIPSAHWLDGIADVKANATLNVQNTTGLTFGVLHSSATINFDSTTAVILNYPNLGLLNGANLPITGVIGIAGTFNPGTTTVATAGSTVNFNGTGTQTLPTSFTYNILNLNNPAVSFSGNLHVDSVLLVNHDLTVDATDTLTLNAGAALTLAATKTLTVKGTFDNQSADPIELNGINGINGYMVIDSNATYLVNANVQSGYLIPAANYKAGSNLNILQGIGKLPATVGGNVTYSSIRSTTIFTNVTNTIGGNFTITAGNVFNGSASGRTVTVNGDLNIAGGIYSIASAGFSNTQNMTVNGNINITSGKIDLGSSFDTFYVYVKGNVLHTGGIFSSSSPGCILNFIGTSQTISTTGLTDAVALKIGSPSTAPEVILLSNLTINATGTLKVFDGSLVVSPNKILTIAGAADFNGKPVIFKSDSTGIASLGQVTGTITNANNITVERYISSLNNPALRLLAPSVNSTGSIHDNWQTGSAGTATHITGSTTGANGFDATASGEPSMTTYNVDITPTTDIVPAWGNIPNTDIKKLQADTGYMIYIRGDRTLDLSDDVASNNTTLRSTGTIITGTRTFTNLRPTVYNLITNPYPSAIKWTDIRTDNPDLVDRYIYWDANIGSRGGYVMVNGDGTTTPTLITESQGLDIQSGMAFFVRPLNTTSVTIKETHKSTTNNRNVFRINNGSIERLTTSLFFSMPDGSKRLADGVTSDYQNDYSTAISGEDALQLANFDEDVAILSNNKLLAIEGRPLIDNDATIQLNVTGLKVKKYEWQFAPTNFGSANLNAVLKDKFLNTATPVSLTQTTTISFIVTADAASSAADRFQIVFAAVTCPGANTWTGAASSAWENPANWSCGQVPDANTDVIINSGTVVVSTNAFCRSLTTNPGVTFTVNSNVNLTVTQ